MTVNVCVNEEYIHFTHEEFISIAKRYPMFIFSVSQSEGGYQRYYRWYNNQLEMKENETWTIGDLNAVQFEENECTLVDFIPYYPSE
ncbi:hypothetical protein D3C80_1883790 [compost metagenome]